jgi:hypothetical protein
VTVTDASLQKCTVRPNVVLAVMHDDAMPLLSGLLSLSNETRRDDDESDENS